MGVGVPEGAGLFDPVLEEELGKFEVNVRLGVL